MMMVGASAKYSNRARVEPARSQVTVDEGWQPDTDQRYRTVLVDVPLPPATVELRGDPEGVALVRAQLADSPAANLLALAPPLADEPYIIALRAPAPRLDPALDALLAQLQADGRLAHMFSEER